jgi:DNA excision repair protein ERCC-4
MITLKSPLPFEDRDRPIIYVDSREASTKPGKRVIDLLKELGSEVRVVKLEAGDYVISEEVGIELKRVWDFVHTLTRRYLFEQLFALKIYPRPIVLVEGYLPSIYKFSKIRPSAIWGSMFALVSNGIPIVQTMNVKETGEFLYTAAKQEQMVKKRSVTIRAFKKVKSLADRQLYLMCGLPNVGVEKARALLEGFKSPLNAFVHVDKWDDIVKGIGPTIKEKVKEVLTRAFQED